MLNRLGRAIGLKGACTFTCTGGKKDLNKGVLPIAQFGAILIREGGFGRFGTDITTSEKKGR